MQHPSVSKSDYPPRIVIASSTSAPYFCTTGTRARKIPWRFVTGLLAVLLLVGCAAKAAVAPGPPPAFGHAFTIDGWSITLKSLDPIEHLRQGVQSLAGTELWVLEIDATNNTGKEARAGDGYRLQGTNGDIVDANLLSAIDPVFGATLASGGHTSGRLTFSLPTGDAPAAVLVSPGSDSVSVPTPPQ